MVEINKKKDFLKKSAFNQEMIFLDLPLRDVEWSTEQVHDQLLIELGVDFRP